MLPGIIFQLRSRIALLLLLVDRLTAALSGHKCQFIISNAKHASALNMGL